LPLSFVFVWSGALFLPFTSDVAGRVIRTGFTAPEFALNLFTQSASLGSVSCFRLEGICWVVDLDNEESVIGLGSRDCTIGLP